MSDGCIAKKKFFSINSATMKNEALLACQNSALFILFSVILSGRERQSEGEGAKPER